jgi:hypothetical protein
MGCDHDRHILNSSERHGVSVTFGLWVDGNDQTFLSQFYSLVQILNNPKTTRAQMFNMLT